MKPQLITSIVATVTTALTTFFISLPVDAKPVQYRCSVRNGVPTTIAQTPQGTVAVISWKSNYFSGLGLSPTKRCQMVSKKFQKYSNQGSLRYITVGRMNNQNVICVAQNRRGACRSDGLLLTLEPRDNPQSVIKDLFNVASRASNRPNVRGSGTQESYINIDDYLQSAPSIAPDSTENETTSNVETEPQQNSGSPAPDSEDQGGGSPVC